ncbi:MAG: hypothetical protein ACFFC3_01460 [Candidatus Odinarchaeota archaeon]
MSDKQSNSSKKSSGSEARNQSKISRMDKSRAKSKIKEFSSKLKLKFFAFKSKLKTNIYDKIIHQEIYIEGKEPKSYSYEKKFFGLYILFIFYSLVLILKINFPDADWINILMLGNPFVFSNTILALFLVLSFLFSVDKIRIYIFEGHTTIKQILAYSGLFTILYILFLFIGTGINYMTYLLALSMIWLILLSSRFYIYSRKFSTKIEARFIKRYSVPRYIFAVLLPFVILAVLVVISLFYRSFLVFLSLDFFGLNDPNPSDAVAVYEMEMTRIMPLIYFSLVMTLVFIIFEYVSTRRRAETKRAGTFDNFTFSLIVFFIFFFQILQISIFLLLQDETIAAFKSTIGTTGSVVSYVFIFEFIISMYFLYRIVKKLGKSLGWRVFIFKKDGLILLCLGCVFAQTLTRFALATNIPHQSVENVGVFLMWDKFIVSILMIFFLGTTLLIYYIKPHETSMFMRLQKETVSEEEKSLDKVYKIIRSEYIRRGEAYPIEIIERELIKATQLSKGKVYDLLNQLAKRDMDIMITEKKQKSGKSIKIIDFISVTEVFEKKGVAEQKARKYLSERIYERALEGESKTSRLVKREEEGKAANGFITSLSAGYDKKQVAKALHREKLKDTQISFTTDALAIDLENQVINIIKEEYIYRIENPEKTPEFYIPISKISSEIERKTKISPGELYPILEELNTSDIEVSLIDNPEVPEDKLIKFFPFADDNMCYSLASFRPEEYSEFKNLVMKNFLRFIKTKREKRIIFQLKKDIPNQTESQKSWIELLNNLYRYYPIYKEEITRVPDIKKLIMQLEKWYIAIKQKQSLTQTE